MLVAHHTRSRPRDDNAFITTSRRRRRAMSDRVVRRALIAITRRISRQRRDSHRRLVATCITSHAVFQSPTGIRTFAP